MKKISQQFCRVSTVDEFNFEPRSEAVTLCGSDDTNTARMFSVTRDMRRVSIRSRFIFIVCVCFCVCVLCICMCVFYETLIACVRARRDREKRKRNIEVLSTYSAALSVFSLHNYSPSYAHIFDIYS